MFPNMATVLAGGYASSQSDARFDFFLLINMVFFLEIQRPTVGP